MSAVSAPRQSPSSAFHSGAGAEGARACSGPTLGWKEPIVGQSGEKGLPGAASSSEPSPSQGQGLAAAAGAARAVWGQKRSRARHSPEAQRWPLPFPLFPSVWLHMEDDTGIAHGKKIDS